jgi:membrane protease YdiL (CAAX protease family)
VNSETPPPVSPHDLDQRQPSWAGQTFLGRDGRARPIIRVILFGIGLYFVSELAGAAAGQWKRNAPAWTQLAWQSFFLLISGLLLSWFFLRAFDGRGFRSLGLWPFPRWGKQLGIGLGLGASLQLGVAGLLIVTRAIHYTRGSAWDAHFLKQLAANAWLFLLAAAFEEIAFRGYALQRLIDATSPGAAIVISSVLFGLAHLANPDASFFSTVNTILAGILLALPYVRTRTMWMQTGLHWMWNFFLGPVISLPVSGIHFGPTLFMAQLSGPAWWTGAAYGPEGGAVVTVLSLCAITWILWTPQLTPSTEALEAVE